VDLVDDLPARKQNTTGQLASQLLTELANITAARARRADSAARELNRPPPTPSTGWTRDLTAQAAALDRAAAHRTVAADQARAGAADDVTVDDPAAPHLDQHQLAADRAELRTTTAAAGQNALAGRDLTEARAAIAAVNTLPARRPAPVAPSGPAGPRPGPTRGAQPTSRPPSR